MSITLSGFDSNHPDFDKLRYIRALRGLVKWKRNGGKGTLMWATGVGKSAPPIVAYNKMKMKNPKTTIIIVVPKIPLKEQWEALLKKNNIIGKVYVINTVVLNDSFKEECDLLVVDEVHRMASPNFRKVFTNIKHRFPLCLTATIERLDGLESVIKQYAPVVDIIPQEEAISKGWITGFLEFNIAVTLPKKERVEQSELNRIVTKSISKFGDFNVMLDCLDYENTADYLRNIMGYEPSSEEIGVFVGTARRGMKAIRLRKEILDNARSKVEAAVEIINFLQMKTIVFSQSTSFADEVRDLLGERARSYHSNLLSEEIIEIKEETKMYKTLRGLNKFAEKLKLEGLNPIVDEANLTISWKVNKKKKLGIATVKRRNLQMHKEGLIDALCTAEALDEGHDDPTVQVGIDASRTNNPGKRQQRTGRTCRILKDDTGNVAIAVYINLYIPDWDVPNSSDQKKLLKYQSKAKNKIVWVNSVDEFKEKYAEVLRSKVAANKQP